MDIEFFALWKGPERALGKKIQEMVRRRVGFADTVWACGVLFLVNSIFGNNDGRRRLS